MNHVATTSAVNTYFGDRTRYEVAGRILCSSTYSCLELRTEELFTRQQTMKNGPGNTTGACPMRNRRDATVDDMTTDGPQRTARVLIAEDEALLRYTLRLIVEEHYKVAGEAADGYEAVEMTEQLRPDVVLLDISMPRMGGIEAAQRIRACIPDVLIIIVSNHSSAVYMEEALNRGAHGYVVKGSAVLQLPKAINEVLNGRIFRPG